MKGRLKEDVKEEEYVVMKTECAELDGKMVDEFYLECKPNVLR